MKPHYIMVILSFFLLTAGCIEPPATDPARVTPSPTMDATTEYPSDDVPSLRDSFFFRFDGWEDPAEYTSFSPPTCVPGEYTLYDLQIFTVLNETEPHDRRTTIGETLRYARNDTMQNASTTDMTLLKSPGADTTTTLTQKIRSLTENQNPLTSMGMGGGSTKPNRNG